MATKSVYMTKSGVFLPFALLQGHETSIINHFTLQTTLITGQIKRIRSCIVDKLNKRVIIPRFGLADLSHKFGLKFNVISQINTGQAPEKPFNWIATQTPNQILLTDYIMSNIYTQDNLVKGLSGLILNLEAGQGKSFVAAYLAYKIQKKTLIVVHSSSLLEQWADVIYKTLGADVNLGFYYAKKKKLGDIMIVIIDSATHDSFTIQDRTYSASEFYNQFGFVVYDECHLYANKFSLKGLKQAVAPYTLGLSATPDESTFDKLIWWELGPVVHAKDIPGYSASSESFTAIVHRMMYYGAPEYTKYLINDYTQMIDLANTLNMICSDPQRNSLIIKCILECLEKNLFTYVFSDRREHLLELMKLLNEKGIQSDILTDANDYMRIVGGATNEELKTAELKSKVIFTTYPYMGTGKSIVKMTGLVLATPRRSKMKQYINRIFRLGSDASIMRHIYDICDMKISLGGQWSTRKKYYLSKNYKIVEEKSQNQ